MAVHVRTSQFDSNFQVAVLSGRLDLEAAEQDYPAVRQALEASTAGIIVDLADVDFVSSAGLRMLLLTYRDCQGAGKALALTRPQPAVYKIFKVAALDTRLPFYDEEAHAIEALTQVAAQGGQR